MIEIRNLLFRYSRSNFALRASRFDVASGEKIALVGPSGSGKTTLLHLIAGILVPAEGTIAVDGEQISAMPESKRRAFRISRIGMVFQRYELIDYLTVLENILLPYYIHRSLTNRRALSDQAHQLAEALGLADKLQRWVGQLSQGEQQRVAIARALLAQPPLILADEPTGSLDPANKHRIIDLLFEQSTLGSRSLVVVTHDTSILEGFDRVVDIHDLHQTTAPVPQRQEAQ